MGDVVIPSIRTFQVFPDLPQPLQPLLELAQNLWWVWQPDAVELFRRLDRKLWEDVYHNPVKLLGAIVAGQAGQLPPTTTAIWPTCSRVYDAFKKHLSEPGLVQRARTPTNPNCWSPISPPSSACTNRCRSIPAAWAFWPAII